MELEVSLLNWREYADGACMVLLVMEMDSSNTPGSVCVYLECIEQGRVIC